MSEARRILYVASSMRHINSFHRDYIAALRDGGATVDVLARGEGADFDIPFEKKLFSLGNTKCRKEIREIIKKGNYDAILLNTSLAAFHVRLACPRKNRPRIVNLVHGYLFSEEVGRIKSLLLRLAERMVKGKTDAIITMNEYDLDYATRKKLTRGRVYASRGMGVTLRESISSPESLRSEFMGDGKLVFAFVGELSGRKNQEFLIRSHAELVKEIPNAVLWLIGDGDARESLEALSRELSVSESVIFVGQRADACDFIRACDVYVSASMIEGLPFNILEALGAGKTVIASRIKGHVDLIEDKVSGYLYAFRDTGAYLSLAKRVASGEIISPEKAIEVFKKYEREVVFPETLATIKEALDG